MRKLLLASLLNKLGVIEKEYKKNSMIVLFNKMNIIVVKLAGGMYKK